MRRSVLGTALFLFVSAAAGTLLVTLLTPSAPERGMWNAALTLAPPANSEITPTGYTLENIYNRIVTNATVTEAQHPLSHTGSVAPSFHSLKDIYLAIPTVNSGTVLSGTTILGIHGSLATHDINTPANSWGYGAMGSGNVLTFGIPKGYYPNNAYLYASGSVLQLLDTDLKPASIASGVTIFDVTGSAALIQGTGTGTPATASQILSSYFAWDGHGNILQGTASCSGGSGALPKTGQMTSYATDDDGEVQAGYSGTRYARGADTASGTVLDNATSLTWTRCVLGQLGSECTDGAAVTADWNTSLGLCNSLIICNNGQNAFDGDCSGSGGILHDDWRMPNVKELESLLDFGIAYDKDNPVIDSSTFPATPTDNTFWSSTTDPANPSNSYGVSFLDGQVGLFDKSNLPFTRCVR